MPTYEYACDACSHAFEREQRITAKPIKKCPQCGKMKARRMIGGGGFILKGGGWESDLYSGASNRTSSASTPTDAASGKPSASDTTGKKSAQSETSSSSATGTDD